MKQFCIRPVYPSKAPIWASLLQHGPDLGWSMHWKEQIFDTGGKAYEVLG